MPPRSYGQYCSLARALDAVGDRWSLLIVRELGLELGGSFMTLRIDKDGPHATVHPDRRPDTILEADPEAVLRVAAGAITIDQALSRASVQGDPRVLATVLGAAQT